MRRFWCIWIAMLCWVTAGGIERRIATLQHQGQMTAFMGDSAEVYAYQAAVDGDSILLSAGLYNRLIHINKSIRIIGLARDCTQIYSPRIYVQANNVYLEGMYINHGITLYDVDSCTLKRCEIFQIYSLYNRYHSNTLLDQCDVYYDCAIDYGINYAIRNSSVVCFSYMNKADHMANFSHCMFPFFYQRKDSASTSPVSVGTWGEKQPYAIYRDCILGLDANAEDSPEKPFEGSLDFQFTAPSQFYNNFFYRINDKYNADSSYYIHYTFGPDCLNEGNTVNLESASAIRCQSYYNSPFSNECYPYNSYTHYRGRNFQLFAPDVIGSDGTPIGQTGGEGYNFFPGVPRSTYYYYNRNGITTDMEGRGYLYLYVKAERAKKEDNPSVARVEYWVDDLTSSKTIIPIQERPGPNDTVFVRYNYDFSELSAGEHIFYYRLQDTYGAYSPMYVMPLIRRNPYDNELYLPYDAIELEGDQQTANPTYSAYPTEFEPQMPPLQCN